MVCGPGLAPDVASTAWATGAGVVALDAATQSPVTAALTTPSGNAPPMFATRLIAAA